MNLLATLFKSLLGLCLTAFCVYSCLAVWATEQWHRARRPLNPAWTPAVTILKPICGVDAEAYENFASFCRLDYPADRMQLLFGALDPNDPAVELVRCLQKEYPELDIHLVCGGEEPLRGHNLKVCNLMTMLPAAKHDLFVLCDSDMRVHPDYLRRVVAPFEGSIGAKPGVGQNAANDTSSQIQKAPIGLVTCPYRGHQVQSVAAVLEALSIGADFIPSTMVSRALEGVGFALGSTIALPRQVLEQLGGFEALADELADDFFLGNGTRKLGYEVVLSDYVVDDVMGKEKFGAMWARRLRWARTLRACRPAGYAGSFVMHGTTLALVLLAATGFRLVGWTALGITLVTRLLTPLWITRRYTQDSNIARFWPFLPISDVLNTTIFVLSFCGNRIVWRGQHFRLLPGGKIIRLTPPR